MSSLDVGTHDGNIVKEQQVTWGGAISPKKTSTTSAAETQQSLPATTSGPCHDHQDSKYLRQFQQAATSWDSGSTVSSRKTSSASPQNTLMTETSSALQQNEGCSLNTNRQPQFAETVWGDTASTTTPRKSCTATHRVSSETIFQTHETNEERNSVRQQPQMATSWDSSPVLKTKTNKIASCFLLRWRDMPRHLQFNPYILTGYRPLCTAWGCINSLFYLHNETINIVTHAIPILYILLTVPALLPWSQAELRFLAWCHFAGILCPWIGSFVYHLFMNLERGEFVYHRLLQLDMLGIWISQSFGAMPMVTATVYCLPRIIRWFIISSYCLLSLWGLYKALTAWSPWERRLCFLLPFIMRILLWGLRVTSLGGGDPAAFQHVILQDAVSIFGAAIGAMHIPEKWFPGTVDMYLNSHNIMHVLVVAAVYSMHIATMRDLAWMSRINCEAAFL